MACPLFLPDSRSAALSDVRAGECAAQPAAPIPADLLPACNNGYARGNCECAARSDSDAYRFLIRANRGGIIDVAWSSERNHHPLAVGTLSLNGAPANPEDGPLERQARVYADDYFRQIGN